MLCPVSQFAVEEYKALQDKLDLERHLRTEAETFGREVGFDSSLCDDPRSAGS